MLAVGNGSDRGPITGLRSVVGLGMTRGKGGGWRGVGPIGLLTVHVLGPLGGAVTLL